MEPTRASRLAEVRGNARFEDDNAEIEASRARIVAAADEARRRLERDLHDGAQQRIPAAADAGARPLEPALGPAESPGS